MSVSICDDCGVEGIGTVWYEDSEGNEIDRSEVSDTELLRRRSQGTVRKFAAYECTECRNYWEVEIQ